MKYAVACLAFVVFACSGKGNVDLSKATKLTAEPVETPKETPVEKHPLFNFAPGTPVALKSLGTIDRTGLSIENDYDGDGIPNMQSTNYADNHEVSGGSNQWVADYPVIEASVAPPVTMKILVLKSGQVNNDEIISQINSDDYEEVKEKGTEKVHQNEVNARSTKIQDEYGSSTGSGGSTFSSEESESKAGGSLFGVSLGGGGSSAASRSESWANKTSYSATKTSFPTIDFKNNLDRDAVTLKSDAAARNARKYRVDRIDKKKESDRIEPNAGTVRAALYIKNLSANMPVRLTNILCTFMFEANNGQLIPVQSFRLRNDDYSLFSVNIYGGSEFGPYVVELPNLNTAEIERALQLGFNPKIFIVDYEMTHVPNSNYKNILTSYQGDNLKIVEENTKGRTAIIKVKGPQMREMYRVAAFSLSNESTTDSCQPDGANVAACPGISMRKALERIRDAAQVRGQWYYATNIEYEDYIFDFGDEFPRMATTPNGDQSKVYLRTVKSIGSVSNRVPCEEISQTSGSPSAVAAELNITNIPVCKVKQFSQMSDSERQQFGVWVVFANGKFYTQSEYEKVGTNIKTFAYNTTASGSTCNATACQAYVSQGIDGTIWVGDNYDWVYLTLEQFLFLKRQFGNNPLETGEVLTFNTKWDLGDANTNVFDPQFHSKYLGQAVLGDQIEIVIDLKDTKYLNPKFHVDDTNGNLFVQNFSYDPKLVDKKFSFEEAIDFEINLGVGASTKDWGNVIQPEGSQNAYFETGNGNGIKNCGKNLDYLAQQFKICVKLPEALPNASADGRVNVYLRPILHNAYRNSVWPKKYSDVNKFQGELVTTYPHPATIIDLTRVEGETAAGDPLIVEENGYRCSYVIASVSPPNQARTAHLTLNPAPNCTGLPTGPQTATHSSGLIVGVRNTDLTSSEVYFSISQNIGTDPLTNYFHDFNAALPTTTGPQQKLLTSNALLNATDCANGNKPLRYGPHCFSGLPQADDPYSYLISNWIGGADHSRSFHDRSRLVQNDYLSALTNTFYAPFSSTSRWRYSLMGSLLNSLAASFSNTAVSTLATARKVEVFQHLDKTLVLWEIVNGARTIYMRIVSNKTGLVLFEDTVHTDTNPTYAGYTPLQFETTQKAATVTLSYGKTWTEAVPSNVPGQPAIGDNYIHSALGVRNINIEAGTVSAEIIPAQLSKRHLTSYRVLNNGGKKIVAYSTKAYDYRDYDPVGIPQAPTRTYAPCGPIYPLGHEGVFWDAHTVISATATTCTLEAHQEGCNDDTESCHHIIITVERTLLSETPNPPIYNERSNTAPANEIAFAEIDNAGNVSEAAAQANPHTRIIENFRASNNSQTGLLEFRDLSSNGIGYTRHINLSASNKTILSQGDWTGSFKPSGHDPQPFGGGTFGGVGLGNDNRVYLMVTEPGVIAQLTDLGHAGKFCTAPKCVNMQKYAPAAAEAIWLEDEYADVNGTMRSLWIAQVTITDANHVSVTSPRELYRQYGLNAPEGLLASERISVVSWIENGQVMARAINKIAATLFADQPSIVYSPSAGTTLFRTTALNDKGHFYVLQSSGLPTENSLQLLQINERNAFSPKYGLNNFFAAPLIERNYTATARVLIR